jgi:stage III sporulation protein AG
MKNTEEKLKGFVGLLLKNKYVLVVLLLGLVLILLPTGKKTDEKDPGAPEPCGLPYPSFSLAEEEERLESARRGIEATGEVAVLLSLKSTASRELASGEEGALVVSKGGGAESAVELRYVYPEYLGAVVVCQGADNARVRLEIVEAVSVFTGVGADRISVNKMK